MGNPSRFYVRSPDGRGIAGYDSRGAAEFVALKFGAGAHVVDTLAPVYHPMVQEVEVLEGKGELVYLSYGSWGTGRFSLERDLIESIKKGHIAIVHAFLAKGADCNGSDDHGDTALCWAAAGGNTAIVSLLVDQGADPNLRDGNGATPLEIAIRKGRGEVVGLLNHNGSGP